MLDTVSVFHANGALSNMLGSEFAQLLGDLSRNVDQPFSTLRQDVIRDISRKLLTQIKSREQPELIALGYWLRPSSVRTLADQSAPLSKHEIRVARGFSYHLPPTNVDTLFVYSWAISFLLGNSNLVRLPTDISKTTNFLLETVIDSLEKFDCADGQIFCQFDFKSSLGETISKVADLRVIWGGDEKVQVVSKEPMKPGSISLGFPDRKSFSIVKSSAYGNLDDAGRDDLANQFYNDLYWFDQMGCGSPRALIWICHGDDKSFKDEFIMRLNSVLTRKGYVSELATDIAKFVHATECLAKGAATSAQRVSPELMVVNVEMSSTLLNDTHGGGCISASSIEELREVGTILSEKLQTISAFGLTESEKIELSALMARNGGFRIVNIGSALSFETIWDGVDLIEHFSRKIVIHK